MTNPPTHPTNLDVPLPDPSQFEFLSFFQSFLDMLENQTINISNIAPLIFELESKFQNTLSYIESLPDQKISLNDQRSNLKTQLEELEQRRQSFQRYQQLLSKRIDSIHSDDVEMLT